MTKLIRDNVALDIMRHDPEKVGLIAGLDLKAKALHNKIIEESLELANEVTKIRVDKDNIIEEAADVMEVVYAICSFYDISITDVYEMTEAKKKIKGGFLTFSCLYD